MPRDSEPFGNARRILYPAGELITSVADGAAGRVCRLHFNFRTIDSSSPCPTPRAAERRRYFTLFHAFLIYGRGNMRATRSAVAELSRPVVASSSIFTPRSECASIIRFSGKTRRDFSRRRLSGRTFRARKVDAVAILAVEQCWLRRASWGTLYSHCRCRTEVERKLTNMNGGKYVAILREIDFRNQPPTASEFLTF